MNTPLSLLVAAVITASISSEIVPESRVVENFRERVAVQRQSQWCWAACIEMVLATAGYDVSQEEVVIANYGRIVDLPAFSADRIRANLTLKLPNNELLLSHSSSEPLTNVEVIDRINRGDLIVAGVSDTPWVPDKHAVIIYGYEIRNNDPTDGLWLNVFDPWPTAGHRKERFRNMSVWWNSTILVDMPERSPSTTAVDREAMAAMAEGSLFTEIEFNESIRDRNVSFEYRLVNTHETHSIEGVIEITSGYASTPDATEYHEHETRQYSFKLQPDEEKLISDALPWFRTEQLMPVLRERFQQCRFIGDPPLQPASMVVALENFSAQTNATAPFESWRGPGIESRVYVPRDGEAYRTRFRIDGFDKCWLTEVVSQFRGPILGYHAKKEHASELNGRKHFASIEKAVEAVFRGTDWEIEKASDERGLLDEEILLSILASRSDGAGALSVQLTREEPDSCLLELSFECFPEL